MENRFRNFVLGRSDFKSKKEILDLVKSTSQDESSLGSDFGMEALLIFQTSKQQTWLVASRNNLYCVNDDIDKGETNIQWSLPSSDLYQRGNVIADISVEDKSQNTGLLSINNRKDWLFSKRLFTMYEIESSIQDLISRAMNDLEIA